MTNRAAPAFDNTEQIRSEFASRRGRKTEIAIVAGAAGFVGSAITEALIAAGVRVVGVDNFVSGKQRYLKKVISNELFEIVETDLQDGIPAALKKLKPKYIIDVLDVSPHIGRTNLGLNQLLNNSIALRSLLEFANEVHARVVYTSSVDIYQGLASHEHLQNYYDGPELSTYYEFLEGKRYGESLCREYVDRYSIDIRVARVPDVYGPHMDIMSSSILARAVRLALEKKDLIFDEEGSRQHQLLYIDDLVFGVLKLLFNDDEKIQGGIFYLVNTEPVSTLSIAYTLREIIQEDVKVEFLPQHRKVGYPVSQPVDISRTMKLLKWSPRVDVTSGLEKTMTWAVEAQRDPVVETSEGLPVLPESAPDEYLSGEIVIDGAETEDVREDETQTAKSSNKQKGKKRGWLGTIKGETASTVRGFTERASVMNVDLYKRYVPDILLGFGLFLLISVIPLLLSGGFGYRAYQSMKGAEFDKADQLFQQSLALLRYYQRPAEWLGLSDTYTAIQQTGTAAIYSARFSQDAYEAIGKIRPVLARFQSSLVSDISDGSYAKVEVVQRSNAALAELRSAQTWFSLLERTVEGIHSNALPTGIASVLNQGEELILISQPAIEEIDQLLEGFPDMLGYSEARRYIVLLQNSAELRPTGGFIGSYMAITVLDGLVVDFKIDDIYNPDGLLENHQNPPVDPVMEAYFGVDFMGIRESNWWSDFPRSAAAFEKLYERATGEEIDGVIAVNLDVAEQILKFTGPLTIEAFNETVTSENVLERALVNSEIGFEPGSTSKRDFLGALSEVLITKLAGMDALSSPEVMNIIGTNVLSRNIMVYFDDVDLQNAALSTGISGAMLGDTSTDYLRVVDANVGANKVNHWVDRSTEYSVDVDREGHLRGRVKVVWNNTATSTTWPSGNYSNYVRVYVPEGVSSVTIDPELAFQIEEEQDGKTVIGGVVEVPVSEKRDLVISYLLPQRLSLGDEVDGYTLWWEPQPGVSNEEISFAMNLPVFLSSQEAVGFNRQLTWPIRVTIPIDGTQSIQKVPN